MTLARLAMFFYCAFDNDKLSDALMHLKYNKHDVNLFHVFDIEIDVNFAFDEKPKRFIDVETVDFFHLYYAKLTEN